MCKYSPGCYSRSLSYFISSLPFMYHKLSIYNKENTTIYCRNQVNIFSYEHILEQLKVKKAKYQYFTIIDQHFHRSKVFIKKGDILSIPYLSPHYRTEERQKRLNDGWHFTCTCSRCLDPTELGAMTSALKCFKCNKEEAKNNNENDCKLIVFKLLILWILELCSGKS